MQILTIDDADFPEILSAFRSAKDVGRYWKNGKVQVVRVSQHFMFVLNEQNLEQIAIKPVRSFTDAQALGRQLLMREEQRGNRVERGNR